MPVEVRRVARDEILDLRAQVLSGGGRRAAVSGDMAKQTRHWGAFSGDELVGCASVMPTRGWALRAMAVAPSHQRSGIGRALLRVVCDEVAEPMWCNARLLAVPFYAAMGWQAVGPVFQLQAFGPHQRMVWHPQA